MSGPEEDVSDEEMTAMMPHAAHLAVAVAFRDPDATATALERAGVSGDRHSPAVRLLLCLADLVTDATGAHLRVEVRLHTSAASAITALRLETSGGYVPA